MSAMFNRSRLMRFLRSLRFRLTLWSLLILTLVLAVFSAFVYTRQANDLQAATADQLGVLTDATLSYLKMNHDQFLASGRVQLDLSSLALGKVAKVEPNAIIVLVGLNGEAVQQVGPLDRDAGARLLKPWFLDSPNRGGVQMTVTPVDSATPQNYTFLLTKADFTDLGVGGALVGLPTDSGGQLPRLAWTLFSGSLLLLLADLGIGYWLAGRLMQPVQAITHTAQSIGETDLSQRLNLRTGDELGELADTFDRMLERLEAAFARQRQFTSDASH